MSLTCDTLPTPTTSFAVPAPLRPPPVLPLQPTPTAALVVAGSVGLEKVQEDDDYGLESMDAAPPVSPVLDKGNLFAEIIPPLDPFQQNLAPSALPMSVKDFLMLTDAHCKSAVAAESGEEDEGDFEDDELDVDLLGPHQLSFPFEGQVATAAFWQGVYISHHVSKLLEQQVEAKGPTPCTCARDLLLDLLTCFRDDGVFDSVCYNSLKGFQQKTEDGTLVAAWCLHCPICSQFISCSSFSNFPQHIMVNHSTERSCLDSYFACQSACSEAGIEWPCDFEGKLILSETSVIEPWDVLESFDLFLSPSSFARIFDKSLFSAAFAFSLVFAWKYCFYKHFGPYLEESQTAVVVTPVENKRKNKPKKRRKRH